MNQRCQECDKEIPVEPGVSDVVCPYCYAEYKATRGGRLVLVGGSHNLPMDADGGDAGWMVFDDDEPAPSASGQPNAKPTLPRGAREPTLLGRKLEIAPDSSPRLELVPDDDEVAPPVAQHPARRTAPPKRGAGGRSAPTKAARQARSQSGRSAPAKAARQAQRAPRPDEPPAPEGPGGGAGRALLILLVVIGLGAGAYFVVTQLSERSADTRPTLGGGAGRPSAGGPGAGPESPAGQPPPASATTAGPDVFASVYEAASVRQARGGTQPVGEAWALLEQARSWARARALAADTRAALQAHTTRARARYERAGIASWAPTAVDPRAPRAKRAFTRFFRDRLIDAALAGLGARAADEAIRRRLDTARRD